MWDRIERLTAPAGEVLSLDDARQASRVDPGDDDAFLMRAIKAARETVEGPDGAGLVLVSSQWQIRFDCMPAEIWIPMGPVLSVDSVVYLDDAGVAQTIAPATYQWRKGRFEARIRPGYNLTWPPVRHVYDAVRVTFTAGFPGTGDEPPSLTMVPDVLRTAMLMLIAHWYERRETAVIGEVSSEIQHGFSELLNRYRVGRFA